MSNKSFANNGKTTLNLFDENPDQSAAPKQRGIKIAGDGMGKSKEAEKGWWEYEDEPAKPKAKDGKEPVNAQQGKGTKEQPFDGGNQDEEDAISREGKEPVNGQHGERAFDKGNEK